uniref:Response regulatory domain-containing protein n=1 Tax=Tetradesmus obliquus TaxID=3088 RepID=A0A383VI30_TETOB|eukprot:jgi/Sobl393_1/16218/SZX64026.1
MLSSVHAAHLESVLHPQDVHVLLVDDEQLSRLVVGNLLRKCDYKVTVAESGAQALEVLQRSLPGTFQLILTDVMMPDVDGLDILRYVRSNAQLADLPVIMMSANERKDAVFEAIRGGAEEYLVKPVTKKEVQNIWQHVWKRLSAAKLLRDQHEADLHTDDAPAAATTTGTQPTSNNTTSLGSSQQQQQLVQQQQQQLQVQQRQLLQSMQQLHRTSQVVQQPDPLAPGQQRPKQQQQQQQRQKVVLSQWLQRAKRSVNAKESIWLFCEVLLLLQDIAAATAGSSAGLLPPGVVRPSRLLLHSSGRVTAAATAAAVDAQEEAAYQSPEEAAAAADSAAAAAVDPARKYSYSLGVLLFDLLYAAQGGPAGRLRALAELRQRSMPPAFLQAHPQEAALLLSLLHPDAAARPSLQQLLASELLCGVCEVLQERRRQRQDRDPDSLVFFLQTMHGRKQSEVQQAAAGVAALDAQIAAVEAALRQVQQGRQQQHHAVAAGQQLAPAGACSSAAAAAAAPAPPAAPAAAAMEVEQQEQQQAAAEHDSDDDEMERREMSRAKRRRLAAAAAPSAVEQQQQQLLLERSGSANSGVAAAAAAGTSDAAAVAAAAASAVVDSQWERVADRFPVLEGVYLKHRQLWEKQQPEEGQKQQQQQQTGAPPGNGASSSSGGSARQLPGYLQSFGEDLWAFSRYSGMAVRGTVRAAADVLGGGSAMVSTAAFDRDDEYLATAGVSKRIRIFEYAAITSSACGGGFGCAAGRAAAPGMGGYSGGGGGFGGGSAAGFGGPMSPGRGAAAAGGGGGADGIVYPVLELSTRSRLSCVAWSSYVKAHLASSDHDGVVTLWDANTGGELVQFEEHSRRAWAVDFSRLEPTRLASCSDDSTVKLWSVHEEASLATLQLHANVCSVQFSPESPHLLACGCANFRTYLFDLRNTAQPLACVHGHRRAVSYVRWLGGEQLVTASTDNTLKLWSVPTMASAGISHCAGGWEASASAASTACVTAYGGHLNQRNFIGLAVLPGSPGNSSSGGLGRSSGSSSRPASGYIVCGSETNEVYAYHTSMPVPVAAHSFGGAGGAAAAAAGGAGGRGRRGGGGSAAELDLLHGEHGEGCGGAGGLQQQGDGPFVSCVAWNRRQGTIVAGNSAGHIKVLELV